MAHAADARAAGAEIVIVTDTKMLRKKSRRVWGRTSAHRIASLLLEEAEKHNAAGLAAPQIGERKRVILVRTAGGWVSMANPKIVRRSPFMAQGEEGCLSLPGITATVSRSEWVDVDWIDPVYGEWAHTHRFYDFEARAVQHEIDHLDGILMTDRQ